MLGDAGDGEKTAKNRLPLRRRARMATKFGAGRTKGLVSIGHKVKFVVHMPPSDTKEGRSLRNVTKLGSSAGTVRDHIAPASAPQLMQLGRKKYLGSSKRTNVANEIKSTR